MSNDLKINNIPSTKQEQTELACMFVQKVIDGDVNPIDAVIQMKSLSETISTFLKDSDVREAVLNEVGKYGKGEIPSFHGALIQVKETGVKYDFTGCGDPVWERLNEEKNDIDMRLKERESFLRTIKEQKTDIDEETGEIITLYAPSKSSTTSYSITFKKR